jgi:hypothetical protein
MTHPTNKTDYGAAFMPTEQEIAEMAEAIREKNLFEKIFFGTQNWNLQDGIRVIKQFPSRRGKNDS